MPTSNLPQTLADVATMEKLPRGAYVERPDGLMSVLINSVQATRNGYRVNQLPDVFTGDEPIKHYFDVRNFAQVIREILMHRVMVLARGNSPSAANFQQAQQESVNLRKRLEKAHQSVKQKSKADMPEIWAFAGVAYREFVVEERHFEDMMRLSLTKLNKQALALEQELESESESNPIVYYWEKR